MKLKNLKLPFKIKNKVLALGSQTKNTVCLMEGNTACLTPIHPDLNNPEDFLNFEKSVRCFLKKRPRIIAYDLHPEYQSTKYALSTLNTKHCKLKAIQHHHSHIVSCMADNGLKNQKVIGAAFDGTGMGTDNTLWGAEFLLCDYKDFVRKAHLRQIPLLGSEKAILEPWRLSAIWLYLIYKDKFLDLELELIKGIDKEKWRVLRDMYQRQFNSPLASSMGRLFDAVASLILAKAKVKFEAELAMGLERKALTYDSFAKGYQFKIIKDKDEYIIDPLTMFKEIVNDLQTNMAKGKIAYQFHLTIAEMIKKMCLILRKDTKVNKVVLSGGVFQNNLLLRLSLELLYKHGFKVFFQKNLPCNDSAISIGEAIIASGG